MGSTAFKVKQKENISNIKIRTQRVLFSLEKPHLERKKILKAAQGWGININHFIFQNPICLFNFAPEFTIHAHSFLAYNLFSIYVFQLKEESQEFSLKNFPGPYNQKRFFVERKMSRLSWNYLTVIH